ncbi:Lrp/AsnC family transcriptional regulator, partial [uncultured Duncaniella sp.]
RATEPGPKERAELWQTAIGLQKVDGLEVSDYLVFFLRNLLLGETNELKNRYLHIRWQSEKPQNDVSEALKPQNDVSSMMPEDLSLKETAVLKSIMADNSISIARLAETIGLSTSTIDRIIKSLKNKCILSRTASTKQLKWEINLK